MTFPATGPAGVVVAGRFSPELSACAAGVGTLGVRIDIPAMKHKTPTTHVTAVINIQRRGSVARSCS